MGLILDTSILIAQERRREDVDDLLERAWTSLGEDHIAISTVSVVELTHGLYRARTEADRMRRFLFSEDAFDLPVHPLSMEIAQLAGKIEGEQAAVGIAIEFEDLVIGATALHLGYAVATLNRKHFDLIPGLKVVTF